MRHFTMVKTRRRVLCALAVAVAAATVLGTAAPASASLSNDNWTAVPLPADYFISVRTAVAPVSCVRHTQFCLTVASDSADHPVPGNGLISDAVLVTRDGGQTWTGYNTLPTAFFQALSISCWSASVCGAAGQDVHGEPQVAFTTDGGQTWTDPTPASWENVDWIATSIDCVSASTCWLTGLNGPFGDVVDPILLKTSNQGASWRDFSNSLPDSQSTNPAVAYALQDISCASAASCVAVGGPNQVNGIGTVLATYNGGRTWTRYPSAKIGNFQSVSCVPGIGVPTCFATGTVNDPQTGAADSVIAASRTGGLSWSVQQDFGNLNPFYSITCSDASHCWAGGNGYQNQALDGTANGGRSWSLVTASEGGIDEGSVSCLSVSVCVATTDNGLWVTRNDGGLTG
jgi:photosystem II stability/assembly factor-like uncharacterized protein